MEKQQERRQFLICLLGASLIPLLVCLAPAWLAGIPRLLSFSEGAWQTRPISLERHRFAALKAPVDIAFDTEGIPHIVADNNEDLFFAQGLLTAHFRLFQMDVTTRAAQGRLSEMLGSRTIEMDRFFISFGMRQAVEATTEFMMKDPDVQLQVRAYLEGVNTYIRQLHYRDLPLEYKLLGVWPQEWDEKRIASLLKIMTFRLSGRSNDLRLTKILKTLGPEKTRQLFPEYLPVNLEAYFVDPDSEKKRDFNTVLQTQSQIKEYPPFLKVFETNGSNAWAIGPKKSKTGRSILANDTHLGYQLPAYWFETQLLTPKMNVYGATFPGAPGIILGFNPNTAWGVTNGTTDVIDWTEFEFKDEGSLEYKFDSGFKTAQVINETITVKNGSDVVVPVVNSDYGYVLQREGNLGLAVRWTGHDTSNEPKALINLSKSNSMQECIAALKDWMSPVQNFICADENNISIYHAGRVPKRLPGHGRVIDRGQGAASIWQGNIPFEELPHEINPAAGFVFSANQRPTGPSYPFYLSWDFEEPFRGQRIKSDLNSKARLDAADMMQMQNDSFDQHAALALPLFLAYMPAATFSEIEKKAFEALKAWSFNIQAESFEATIFEAWWKRVESTLWDELTLGDRPYYPKKSRTIWLFRQLASDPTKWQEWIKPAGSAGNLVIKAFHETIADLTARFGDDMADWKWKLAQKTELPHLARIPGLGSGPLTMDGSRYSIMANNGNHGPAWKMVVELGVHPRAWAQFPGGVTGNPLDPNYNQFVQAWTRGEMRSVQFWQDKREAMSSSAYIWRWEQL